MVHCSATQRRKFSAPWFHLLKGLTFFSPYMEYHILEFEHPDDLFLQGSSGGALPTTSVTGASPACSANEVKSSAMFTFTLKRFLYPSKICTCTCRPCWSLALISWLYIPIHMHQQNNEVARSYTSKWDFCCRVRLRHVPWMDLKVWRACID